MTSQKDKARQFATLHKPGEPLIRFNAWDPGGAMVWEEAGARAIATGSWSVAAAFGFEDGEKLPRELALANLERIVSAVSLPVTVDLEGGYGRAPAEVAETASRAIGAGAIGCNLEDQVVGGRSEEHTSELQSLMRISYAVFCLKKKNKLKLQKCQVSRT